MESISILTEMATIISALFAGVGLLFTGFQIRKFKKSQEMANYQNLIEREASIWADLKEGSFNEYYFKALGIDPKDINIEAYSHISSLLGFFESIYYQNQKKLISNELGSGWLSYMDKIIINLEHLPELWSKTKSFYWKEFQFYIDNLLENRE